MAEMNFDNPNEGTTNPVEKEIKNETQEPIEINFGGSNNGVQETIEAEPTIEPAQNVETNSAGMTMEELNDPNKIKVTIADDETPLVILFGPPSSGKTMVLIRLTRYLRGKDGFKVEPIRSFRPAYDRNYHDICENFDALIDSDDAARSTSRINFILSSENRKVWAIMVEPEHTNNRMDTPARRSYADKVKSLQREMGSRDKVVFVFNKIDKSDFVIRKDRAIINYKEARKYISKHYPNIYTSYTNVNPLTKWFQPYNFGFIAFQTGTFPIAADGTKTFEQGHNAYPQKLWEMIRKRI